MNEVFKSKNYAHFDSRKDVKEYKAYLYNKDKIKRHSFYPFVLDIREVKKVSKLKKSNDRVDTKTNLVKESKIRKIMFSSHLDRYVYQLYNNKLNELYNIYMDKNGISECSIAYRNVFKRKSNINFAHDVFKFILSSSDSYVLVGDFKNFFDNLDHDYLKKMLCKLMDRNNLEEDYYAVFKNVTKYKYFDLNDICKIKNIDKAEVNKYKEQINESTGEPEYIFNIDRLMTKEELNMYKSKYLKYNNKAGIPQGSAISSVLSNIYMIEVDKQINQLVKENGGIYKRYSDDFIIVIPGKTKLEFKEIFGKIEEFLENNGKLKLQEEKTQVYYYSENKIVNKNKEILQKTSNSKNELEYLGFCFTGDKIKIRDKTLSKFYYRMYKKIKTIALMQGKTKTGKTITNNELYRVYSKYGKKQGKGNFITYAERCEAVFKDMEQYYISYKNRFFNKLKSRYNKCMKMYKNIDSKKYYSCLKRKKEQN